MMLWAPLSAPASCKSVLQMTRLHPRRALLMLKPELSFSNALMKSAVFICGGSKCCDIRSICQSAQPSKQWPRRDLIIHSNLASFFWQPIFSPLPLLSPCSSYTCGRRIYLNGMCSRNQWDTKKYILGWWERRKGSRHFQAAVLWFAILPQITPVEFLRCRSTIWEWADKCIAGMIYNSHTHTPCIPIYNSSQFCCKCPSQGPSYTLQHP